MRKRIGTVVLTPIVAFAASYLFLAATPSALCADDEVDGTMCSGNYAQCGPNPRDGFTWLGED